MNPDRHATSHYDYFKDLIKGDDASAEAHRKFYDEYNAVLDMDADYYLETIQTVFQDYKLVHGTWDVRSPEGKIERVRPEDIKTTALFTVEGELDDISGSGQTEAAHDLCTGIVRKEQHHLEAKGAGHYGIFSGRRWRDIVYPKVRAFILQHDGGQSKAAVPVVNETAAPANVAKTVTAPKTKAPVPAPMSVVPRVAAPTPPAAVKNRDAKAAGKRASTGPTSSPSSGSAAAKSPAPASAVTTRWVQPQGGTVTGAAAPVQDDITQAKAAATSAPTPSRRNTPRKN